MDVEPDKKRIAYIANRVPTADAQAACSKMMQEIPGLEIQGVRTLHQLFYLLFDPDWQVDFIVIDIEECYALDGVSMWDLVRSLNTLSRLETATNAKKPVALIAGISDTTPLELIRAAKKSPDFATLNPLLGGRFTYEMCLDSVRRYTNWDWTLPKCISDMLKKSKTKETRSKTPTMTARQKEIFQMIAQQGMSNKHIARALGISDNTVKIHVSALMKRVGCHNRTQLAAYKERIMI